MRELIWLLCSGLCAATTAQTFVVDASNGPGTHYTSIAAATAAVPSGATLLVRPGIYGEFVIDNKSLTVIGGAGVEVANSVWWIPAFEIKWIAASQRVVLQGIALAGPIQSARVHDCAGAVVLEDLAMSPAPTNAFGVGDIWIRRCDQVALRGWNASEVLLWLIDSRVVLESCVLRGQVAQQVGSFYAPSSSALLVEGGVTELVDCRLYGGGGDPNSLFGWNRPAIDGAAVTQPVFRILAPCRLEGASAAGWAPAPAIAGGGSLRLDPAVALVSSAGSPIDPGYTVVSAPMPAVLGSSAPPGGSLTASALGPTGVLAVLVLGLPGPPFAVPGIADPVWIDPGVFAFYAIGVPQVGVPLTGSVAVPNHPSFVGLILAWQSVAATGAGLQASNPSWTLVR